MVDDFGGRERRWDGLEGVRADIEGDGGFGGGGSVWLFFFGYGNGDGWQEVVRVCWWKGLESGWLWMVVEEPNCVKTRAKSK